jgi:hypothetical protein
MEQHNLGMRFWQRRENVKLQVWPDQFSSNILCWNEVGFRLKRKSLTCAIYTGWHLRKERSRRIFDQISSSDAQSSNTSSMTSFFVGLVSRASDLK